jgi:hypothetical protein
LYLGYTLFTAYYDSIRYVKVKYFKYTNKTQKSALDMLTRIYEDGNKYKCPECNSVFYNINTFEQHISDHGYPRDIDLDAYLARSVIPKATDYVKKADSKYLAYL